MLSRISQPVLPIHYNIDKCVSLINIIESASTSRPTQTTSGKQPDQSPLTESVKENE